LPAAAARDRAPAPTLSPVPSAQPAAAEVRDGSAAAPHDAGVGESPTPDEAALATEGGSTGDFDPPPTRVGMEAMTEHAYTPSNVAPVPEVPEAGLVPAARYTLAFLRARWQRHLAIKRLRTEISENTTALDRVLGTLGQRARALGQGGRVFAAENAAIDAAEERRKRAELSCAELQHRQAEENGKFAEIEDLRQAKVAEAEQALEKAQHELGGLEVQRRALRDRRKTIERQQRGFLKAAEEREERAVKAASGEERASARRAADDLRRDAAALDPERQDLERRMGALEKPISQCTAKVEAIRAELDSARRSLNDAREGHRYRMAEIEAEQGRKNRELAQADAEIHRRMVTLGTLINLNRIDRPEFGELYAQIDELRSAIGARSTEIDRFLAEREAFDRASLWRGSLVLGGAGLLVLALLGLVGALL
jgi:flagellar biosynthesis chaperone FliJ